MKSLCRKAKAWVASPSRQLACPSHQEMEGGSTYNEDGGNGDGRVHENCGGSTEEA